MVAAKPGLFDYSNGMDKGRATAATYGANVPTGGGGGSYGQSAQSMYGVAGPAQQRVLGMYADAAAGRGPSAAQAMMQQQAGAIGRAGLQQAAMGRGGNLAGMQQQALSNTAGAQAQASASAAALRAQEQQAGMQGYAQQAAQMYGQGLSHDQMGLQGGIAGAQNALDWYRTERGLDMQQDMNQWNRGMQVANATIGGVIGGLDAVGSMAGSDERLKQNVQTIDPFEATPSPFTPLPQYAPDAEVDFGSRVTAARNSPRAQVNHQMAQASRRADQGPQYATSQYTIDPFEEASRKVEAHPGPQQPTNIPEAAPMPAGGPPGQFTDIMTGLQAENDTLTGIGSEIFNRGVKSDARAKRNVGYTYSDERQKMGAAGSSNSATAAIDNAPAVSFEYKPGAGPPGRRAGIMAQDLERTPAGKAVVMDTPGGKMVDGAQAATLALAALNESRQREKAMEQRVAQLEAGTMTGIGQAESGGRMVSHLSPGAVSTVREIGRARPQGDPEENVRRANMHLMSPEVAAAQPAHRRSARAQYLEDERMGEMSPAQRQIVDDFWDEMDKWKQTDERGHTRYTGQRTDFGQGGRNLQRYVDADEENKLQMIVKMAERLRAQKSRGGGGQI